MLMLKLTHQIEIAPDVLIQELGSELVLLNLASEAYFGLDDVGNAMWSALKETGSVQSAYDRLLEQYDVDPEVLKQDLLNLIEQFVEHDLVKITST
jgi:Coenzyme PQQ synthesis protein D (PqqD)